MWRTCPSPFGEVLLEARDGVLVTVHFAPAALPEEPPTPGDALLDAAADELAAYFAGELRAFTVPVGAPGTAFQRRVWAALCEVPYGTTTTYGRIAERVGAPTAVRAVGAANGRNPVAVLVPCHRVIASDGALRGYAGGLDRKRALLDLERGPEEGTLF